MRPATKLLGVVAAFAAGCGGGGGGAGSPIASSAPGGRFTAVPITPVSTPGTQSAISPIISAPSPIVPRTKTAVVVARSGAGFLESQNGWPILHVKGATYDRGYQYGVLFGDEIEENIEDLISYGQTAQSVVPGWLIPVLAPLLTTVGAAVYQPYFPLETMGELNGIIDGAAARTPPVALTLADLVFVNSIIDIAATTQVPFTLPPIFKCSGTAVLPPLTVSGKVFQQRNVDLFCGSGIESQAVVVVEKPASGFAWVDATWAGLIGSASGMNEHGVAVSQVWAMSNDVNIGEPWVLVTRNALQNLTNVDGIEAAFAASQRTYGSNFVFADRGDGRGTPYAIALESTAHLLAQFHDADPAENAVWKGNPLPIRVPHAVFRGDTAMCEQIFLQQYGFPAGVDPRSLGGYCDRYAQQASMIQAYEAQGTLIGLPQMETISHQIAEPSGSLQCVVYENTDLALHVSNSRIVPGAPTVNAKDEPFQDYDFDYYLPTVSVTPDQTTYAAGATATLTIAVVNDGRPRNVDVWASVVAGGQTVPLGSAPVASFAVWPGNAGNAVVPATFPSVPAGPAEIVLELDEGGTRDVVDYGVATVTAN
jgi:hypothetical protein